MRETNDLIPTNILHLPAYRVDRVDTTDHDYHIYAEVTNLPYECPHCASESFVGFGRREQLIRDLPIRGKRVGVYVNTRRFKCQGCKRTFYESLPEVDEKRLMTSRLVKWIGQQSVKRPFLHIAEEIGIDEKTVKNVFRDYINELEKTFRFETPKWMGIDEINIIRPRCMISNIHNNTIVEILPNREKKTVMRYLHDLEGRDDVRYVAMDMWNPYRDAVRATLPQAIIVIDKFHVLRMANEGLESARKSLRQGLTPNQRRGLMHDRFILLKREKDLKPEERIRFDVWTKNYPAIGEAYRLKEQFFGIYEAESRSEAVYRYDTWKHSIPVEVNEYFQPIITAWTNWNGEILAYFEHSVTNAFTESLNSLIRVMNRLGRGYSFEALRAKILFTEGVQKKVRPKFERQERYTLPEGTLGFMVRKPSTQFEKPERNYGADISTLIRMIEQGRI